MLARAVQQHDAAAPMPARQTQKLSQQLFTSSPPAGQYVGQSPFRQQLPASSTLKPSHISALNQNTGYHNPLKRTAAQVKGVDSSSPSSWQTSAQEAKFVGLKQSSSVSAGGVVDKLHETVYFDENDFIPDADLHLDGEDSNPAGHLVLPSAPKSVSSGEYVPASNALLDWSSSPQHHKNPPPNAHSLRKDPSVVPLHVGEVQRPAKRRTLPWANAESTELKGREAIGHKLSTNSTSLSQNVTRQAFTPVSKSESTSPYPWNKTASAVREEQKQHRQHANQVKKAAKTVNNAQDIDGVLTKRGKREVVATVFLSDEQRRVLSLVVEENRSVFFTGPAGTGKSVLMREIITVLRKKYQREPDRIAVTASTGLAACNVGGVTLHSFGGIGLGKEDVPTLVKKIKRNAKAKLRWQRTKVLVIDEISMVDGDLFDKLESIARSIRGNGRPFGGIQLVITGDFFQLPPVPDNNKVAKFAFDAATWATSINYTVGLKQVFRQKDPVFANMLNEMRVGRLSAKSISAFHSLSRKLDFRDDFEATELFSTRNEVENANNMRMRNLGGTAVTFDAEDGGSIQEIEKRDKLLANCMAPAKITVKKEAQVMLIKNLDDTLVNGSLGKVVNFMDEKTFDYYHENEDDFQKLETQDVDDETLARRAKLKALMGDDLVGSTIRKWPVVRFHIADGTTRDLLCQRETWKIELPNGEVQAYRSQIPLILAWALSIHKAQGQTLERVKVDLGKIFEKGQAYVALSRATCQEGLQISRFDPKKVMAHDKVRIFYDALYNADQLTRSIDVK